MPQALLKWNDQQFDVGPFLKTPGRNPSPLHTTGLGALYAADCMKVLPLLKNHVVDTIFADPPFNLGKEYGKQTDDSLPDEKYVLWCRQWLTECVRVLKPGGSLFLYNLPKWNVLLGAFLHEQGLEFRHWIAIEISACLPIQNRLHPSHYSLLYYSKGKPKTFYRIRTPILTCRHCGGEVKDYGGHRGAMNPKGCDAQGRLDGHPSGAALEIQIEETPRQCALNEDFGQGYRHVHGTRRPRIRPVRRERNNLRGVRVETPALDRIRDRLRGGYCCAAGDR